MFTLLSRTVTVTTVRQMWMSVLWIMEAAAHTLTALTHLETTPVPVLEDTLVTDSAAQVRARRSSSSVVVVCYNCLSTRVGSVVHRSTSQCSRNIRENNLWEHWELNVTIYIRVIWCRTPETKKNIFKKLGNGKTIINVFYYGRRMCNRGTTIIFYIQFSFKRAFLRRLCTDFLETLPQDVDSSAIERCITGVKMGQNRGTGHRIWPLTKAFLVSRKPLYKISSKSNKNCDRSGADRETDRQMQVILQSLPCYAIAMGHMDK